MLEDSISQAFIDEVRKNYKLVNPMSSQRLFHGRGGVFPGLENIVVEYFSGIWVVKFYGLKAGQEGLIKCLEEFSKTTEQYHSLYTQIRDKGDNSFKFRHGVKSLEGKSTQENNIKYHLDFSRNLNCGIFLDTFCARDYVLKNSKNKKVLNLFSYTGLFSVASLLGEANKVINIDNNQNVLNKSMENHRLNNVLDPLKVQFKKYNITKSWKKILKLGPFDLIIIDPPTFQKGSFNLETQLANLLINAKKMLAIEAQLILIINSPYLQKSNLEKLIIEQHNYEIVGFIDPPAQYKEKNIEYGIKTFILKNNCEALNDRS